MRILHNNWIFSFFLSSTGMIVKNFSTVENASNSPDILSNQNASGVINQYKEIIRDQDFKLQRLQNAAEKTIEEIENLKKQLNDAQQTNTQLFDQNILLKAQLAAATNGHSSHAQNVNGHSSSSVSTTTEMEFYKAENSRLNQEISNLNSKLNEALDMTEKSLGLTEIGRLRKDQEDLLELLTDQVSSTHWEETFICLAKLYPHLLQAEP